MKKVHVESGAYFDSVLLMRTSTSAKERSEVREALVAMATEVNRELAANLGFSVDGLGPDDLFIALDLEEGADADAVVTGLLKTMREGPGTGGDSSWRPKTLEAALAEMPDANLAIVSVAGAYAGREARQALERGLHVMLFSDNVPLEEEIALKKLAEEKRRFLMGPDCGTAIVHGVPLCFANAVRGGTVGVVAASGTGLQEVTSLVHRLGGGVSQALGTGGRDLKSEAIGGAMIRAGIRALAEDPNTDVIVVVSKPPAPAVAEGVRQAIAAAGKPAVVHFVGEPVGTADGAPTGSPPENAVGARVWLTRTLAGTAAAAVALARGGVPDREGHLPGDALKPRLDGVAAARSGKDERRKYLRGLFAGGTLADEAIALLRPFLGAVHSLSPGDPGEELSAPYRPIEHTILDLGEDVFTQGRAHPMIDPTLRSERIESDGGDPETAVLLLDFVIGYGSHDDPVTAAEAAIQGLTSASDGGPVVVASVTGTDEDPQSYTRCRERLEGLGVFVADSNAEAVCLALAALDRSSAESAAANLLWTDAPAVGESTAREGAAPESSAAGPWQLIDKPLRVVNIGVREFALQLEGQGVAVIDVDWRPAAGGNARMAELLRQLGR